MSESGATLHGSWRLISFDLEFQNSDERRQPLGSNPNGYLVLTDEGRLMTLMTAKDRQPGHKDAERAELFRTMLAYTGHYRTDGEQLITKVDASWNEAWNGTIQDRSFSLDGDRLVLESPWAPHPGLSGAIVRSVLHWERLRNRGDAGRLAKQG